MASFAKPKFARQKVDAAGEVIATTTPDDVEAVIERDQALGVMSNWRSAHGWPLNSIQNTLRGRAERVAHEDLIAVVQRLKRLPSIERKLRQTSLNLSQIQDIAGCRAVLPSIAALEELDEIYLQDKDDSSRVQSDHWKHNNYVQEPKPDGYRSIHHIYEYYTNREKRKAHNGMRVEIQLRSALQHAWATAVETISAFTGEGLKWGEGDPRWLRFFKLMSAAIARREGRPPVPGAPEDGATLVQEIRALDEDLNVLDTLSGRLAVLDEASSTTSGAKDPDLYLLVLDADEKKVHIMGFKKRHRREAEELYMEKEKETQGNPDIDVVQVDAGSLAELKRGYPNYWADTQEFLRVTRQVIEGR